MTARQRKGTETFTGYRANLKKEALEQKRKLEGKIIYSYPKSNNLRIKNIEKESDEWEKNCNKKFIDKAPKTKRLFTKYRKEVEA